MDDFAFEQLLCITGTTRTQHFEVLVEDSAQRLLGADLVVDNKDGALSVHGGTGSLCSRRSVRPDLWLAMVSGVRDFGTLWMKL